MRLDQACALSDGCGWADRVVATDDFDRYINYSTLMALHKLFLVTLTVHDDWNGRKVYALTLTDFDKRVELYQMKLNVTELLKLAWNSSKLLLDRRAQHG